MTDASSWISPPLVLVNPTYISLSGVTTKLTKEASKTRFLDDFLVQAVLKSSIKSAETHGVFPGINQKDGIETRDN